MNLDDMYKDEEEDDNNLFDCDNSSDNVDTPFFMNDTPIPPFVNDSNNINYNEKNILDEESEICDLFIKS